jgi:hypothetical protein
MAFPLPLMVSVLAELIAVSEEVKVKLLATLIV